MSAAVATAPAGDSPKLVKKASAVDVKGTSQTVFACVHVKNILTQARTQAVDGYTKIITALHKEGNLSDRIHKSTGTPTVSSRGTYLCMQCPYVSGVRERHHKSHGFSVDSSSGYVYCIECKDFVYDVTFEEVRNSFNSRKRKHAAILDGDDRRLVAINSAATPCAATGLRGLYNMGQTCFMSVILQSLIHNPLMRTFYLAEGHRSTECEREACTSCALDDIFNDFFVQDKHEGYGAVNMLQGCWKGGGGLAGYSQQDAHEYLGFILNSLHEANTEDDEKLAKIRHTRDCPCVVHKTFFGLLRSTMTCMTCKNTIVMLEEFNDLSLDVKGAPVSLKKKKLALANGTPLKEPPPMDLAECLERYVSAETLSSDQYHCRNCNAPRDARKKLSLSRLPPVIHIHLKRFSHSKANAKSTKIETRVRFPLTLDLTPYITATKTPAADTKSTPAKTGKKKDASSSSDSSSDDDDGDNIEVKIPTKPSSASGPSGPEPPPEAKYVLSSVVVHKGTLDNGHYISYSRQGREWFRFDDSMVVRVHEREVLMAEAYMLFYVVGEI